MMVSLSKLPLTVLELCSLIVNIKFVAALLEADEKWLSEILKSIWINVVFFCWLDKNDISYLSEHKWSSITVLNVRQIVY